MKNTTLGTFQNGRDRATPSSFLRTNLALWIFILLFGALASPAQSLLINFGSAGAPVLHGAAPLNDPVNYWNNVTDTIGVADTGQLLNLITSDNFPTHVGLQMIRRFNGANTSGTFASTVFPQTATQDSLFGNVEEFGGLTNILPSFKITGLDPAGVCAFTFYASRDGVGDNRETAYTVAGTTSQTTTLDPANNVDAVSPTVSGIHPTAAGEITISLAPGPNNNNSTHFIYLAVLQMDAAIPQTPIGFTFQPISQNVVLAQLVALTAAVTGAPPYTIQWYQDGVEIPAAHNLTYEIPSVTPDLDGVAFSVSVSNRVFGARSTNAVLRVVTDTNAPVLLSVISPSGFNVQVNFNEVLEPFTAADPGNYTVNGQAVAAAALMPGNSNVFLTLSSQISGTFTVAVSSVQDLVGNPVPSGTSLTGVVPALAPECFLFDFGAGPTLNSYPPNDPVNFWNNVTDPVTQSDIGELPNLVTSLNRSTGVGLIMLSRFDGANIVGTTDPNAPFPANATSDSQFGHTEEFDALTNVFPSFKLTGLDLALSYTITFYASRMGVGDNRETAYTVVGSTTNLTTLNAANNVTNTAVLAGVVPSPAAEITIRLAPGPNNNNGFHFTYLGVLKVLPVLVPPQFRSALVSGGQINLEWTGGGQLEWAPALSGPWTAVTPAPTSPHAETVVPGQNRFFRLKK